MLCDTDGDHGKRDKGPFQSAMQRLGCRVERFARSYSTTSALPWFVDQSPVPPAFTQRASPPHLPQRSNATPPLPENTPKALRDLHAQLSQSPHLEPSTLVVSQPLAPPPGPPLPRRLPQGRRKRGGTYPGESMYEIPGGIWNWVVMAQVSHIMLSEIHDSQRLLR